MQIRLEMEGLYQTEEGEDQVAGMRNRVIADRFRVVTLTDVCLPYFFTDAYIIHFCCLYLESPIFFYIGFIWKDTPEDLQTYGHARTKQL